MRIVVLILTFILSTSAFATDKAVSEIDQQLEKVTESVAKVKDKKVKAKLVKAFHSDLERRAVATKKKGKAYWYATELQVKLETIMDRDCKSVRKALITGDQNNIDGDHATISKDTQKVLRLADAYCK